MRKGTKKLMALLCAAGLVFSMFGCGGETPEAEPTGETADETVAEEAVPAITKADEEYKIAVLLPGPTGYFVATKEGIDAAAIESGVTIEYADSQWDSGKQVAQAENFITNGVDLLALCCVDSAAGEQIVALANEAEIPIIAFCNAIGENENGQYDGLVSYVGQNEVNTGKVTGEVAKSLLGEKGGKAVLIEGVPEQHRRLTEGKVLNRHWKAAESRLFTVRHPTGKKKKRREL